MIKKCKVCGKKFITYLSRIKKGGGKYCSRDCHYKGREYPKGKDNSQYKEKIKKICPVCGKEFWRKPYEANHRIYCSVKCAEKDRKLNSGNFKKGIKPWVTGKTKKDFPQLSNSGVKKGNIPWNKGKKGVAPEPWNKGNRNGKILTCAICNKEYYAPLARIKQGSKYCNWECFNESKRRVTGEKHLLYNRIDITCDYCRKVYKEIPAKIRMYKKHFCSRRCQGCYSASHQSNPSSIEKKLAGYLIDHKISFVCQFKYKLGVADFFIKPNLIIEVDGDYRHNLPNVKERDKRQTIFLEGKGYTVLHLWEYEINKNPEKCIEKIKSNIAIY